MLALNAIALRQELLQFVESSFHRPRSSLEESATVVESFDLRLGELSASSRGRGDIKSVLPSL